MIAVRFGKGQRLADIARIGLSQGIVPAFQVIRFACALTDAPMRRFRKDQRIRIPEIAKTVIAFVSAGNASPELSTGSCTPIPNHTRDDLVRPPTHGSPEPPFIRLPINKGPNLIEFQGISGTCGNERLWNRLSAGGFFLTRSPKSGA